MWSINSTSMISDLIIFQLCKRPFQSGIPIMNNSTLVRTTGVESIVENYPLVNLEKSDNSRKFVHQ